MAREIQILRWCDGCAQAEPEVRTPGVQTLTVGVTDGEDTAPALRVVDLCADHYEALIAPLRVLLADVGQTPEIDTARRPADVRRPPSAQAGTCDLCGRTFTTMGALVAHVLGAHADIHERPVLPDSCSLCDFVAVSAYGARMHRTATHKISALDDAYTAAAAAGRRTRRGA